jgi:Raf kinase inhibitor-like YbhB/YbcL family protein
MFRCCPSGTEFLKLRLLCIFAGQLGCQRGPAPPSEAHGSAGEVSPTLPFQLKAKQFGSGAQIPREFTCDGVSSSPELIWTRSPAGTQSFALIMQDSAARAGSSVHWVVYDVPPTTRELPEAVAGRDELVDGTRQGLNDFGKLGYSGPCPQFGTTARYSFKLFALDTKLNLKPQATKEDVERAMEGHVLAQAELVGLYARSQVRSPR